MRLLARHLFLKPSLINVVTRLTDTLKEYHQKEDEWNERFGREMEAKSKLQKVLSDGISHVLKRLMPIHMQIWRELITDLIRQCLMLHEV